jgi:hypothetical protein
MKAIIITLGALALCLPAQAQSVSLSTTDGDTYTGITFERVEPDGLYIEYSLPGGGFGMSKVKFSRLSRPLQRQFGFDKSKARDYEDAIAQANTSASQDLINRYQAERDARNKRDAENESAYIGRMAEITRINIAVATAFLHTDPPPNNPSSHLDYGAQFSSGRTTTQTEYATGPTGDLFPGRGTTIKSH